MSKRKTITRVLLSTTALGLSILGGYKIYSSIPKENTQIEEKEEASYIDNTRDVLTDEPIYAKTLSLNSSVSATSLEATNNGNSSTLLASSLYVQHGTYNDKDALRYVVAVPHLNVGVTFIRTLYFEDGETYSKTIVPSSAYTAIKAGDGYISPSTLNEDFDEDGITDTDYQYFVCYTMSGINDDYAKLAVEVQVEDYKETSDDYTNQGTTKCYNIANVAGLTYSKGTYYADYGDEEDTNYYIGNLSFGFVFLDQCIVCDGYEGEPTEIEIPDYINYKEWNVIEKRPVEKIQVSAFSGCSSLTSITIPDNVSYIGDYAFSECENLTSITIPEGVTYIGSSAFQYCENITEITIPQGVEDIGDSTFEGCFLLGEITIPNSVESIGNSAFQGCSSLGEISIPNKVTSICESAFEGCSSLWKISIPSSVESIGSAAFYDCSSLGGISIPNSVTSIGSAAFFGCSNLTSIEISSGVTYIEDSTFYGCENLSSIIIPDSVTSIGNSAFQGCSSLGGISIPNKVTSIGSYAFYDCSSLEIISIPDSVETIGDSAFEGCPIVEATIPASAIAYIPKEALETVTINSGEMIDPNAFKECSNLTTITISDSVTDIGSDAFENCPIKEATIPASAIEYIPKDALETVIITSGDSIGDYAFSGCSSLTSITIPDSVETIGDSAFSGCSELNFFASSSSLESIGENAFYDCGRLTSIAIPSSVQSIGSGAFDTGNYIRVLFGGSQDEWDERGWEENVFGSASYEVETEDSILSE